MHHTTFFFGENMIAQAFAAQPGQSSSKTATEHKEPERPERCSDFLAVG